MPCEEFIGLAFFVAGGVEERRAEGYAFVDVADFPVDGCGVVVVVVVADLGVVDVDWDDVFSEL